MKIFNSSIKKSIHLLNSNECIGIPTETVYGLAANAYSDKAVMKVYALKRRPKTNRYWRWRTKKRFYLRR